MGHLVRLLCVPNTRQAGMPCPLTVGGLKIKSFTVGANHIGEDGALVIEI